MIQRSWFNVNDFTELNVRMKELIESFSRFDPLALVEFFQDNVAASQTAVVLGIGLGAVDEYVMPRTGHVIGVAVYSNAARTAGQLNVYPTINGTALARSAQLDATNTQTHTSKIERSLANAFVAGRRIGAKITTTAAWAPTTADIIVCILVQFSMED